MSENLIKDIETFREAILKGLEEKFRESSPEKLIKYQDVSRAFPGDPHQFNLEIKQIDEKTLKQWCSENGLEVSYAKASFSGKNIDPKYFKSGMPPLIFRKLVGI